MSLLKNHVEKKGLAVVQVTTNCYRSDKLWSLGKTCHEVKVINRLRNLLLVELEVIFAGRRYYWSCQGLCVFFLHKSFNIFPKYLLCLWIVLLVFVQHDQLPFLVILLFSLVCSLVNFHNIERIHFLLSLHLDSLHLLCKVN